MNKMIKIGDYTIEIREDGMFNVSSLLEQWNEKNNACKRFDMFMRTDKGKAAISGFEKDGIKVMDRVSAERTKGKPKITTWFHPCMFEPFVKWLSPLLIDYIAVCKVSDKIKEYELDRKIEGEFSKLESLVSSMPNSKYEQIRKGVTWVAARDKEELDYDDKKLLYKVVSHFVFGIKMGFISDYNSLTKSLMNVYNKEMSNNK